jgi:hypothetical protein
MSTKMNFNKEISFYGKLYHIQHQRKNVNSLKTIEGGITSNNNINICIYCLKQAFVRKM